MPYLHCPICHRTAWLSNVPREPVACRRCGAALDPVSAGDARFLAGAVRDLRAREPRFGRAARRTAPR